jgi:hypothetical protein
MDISNQNNISKNSRLFTNPKTDNKALPINIMLDGIGRNKAKNFDVFDFTTESDMRKTEEGAELDKEVKSNNADSPLSPNSNTQLNRAQAQHLWVDVGGKKVSTFVTPDGVWMAKNGGVGKEAYERVDLSVENSGISKPTMQELKQMSMMLGFMPSGQLSVTPSSYGRSILSERGAKLSDLAGVYNVQELQELLNNGKDMSKLTSKPSLFTSEQIDWLSGKDMMVNTEGFQTTGLKEILQELTNAFAAVQSQINNSEQSYQYTKSAFQLIIGNNRGFLASQLMNMNFNGDASVAFLEQARIDSEKKIDLFADTFLKNFEEHGAGAFSFAWAAMFDVKT